MNTAAQFLIQILQAFVITGPRFHVDLFSKQFRYVGNHLVAFVGTLDKHLAVLFLPAAIDHLVFQLVTDLDRISHDVGFACFQHLDQPRRAFGYFHIQLQAFRAGEVLDQFVFVTHRLHLVLEIGGRAVERDGGYLALRLELRQVDRDIILLLLLLPGTITARQQQRRKKQKDNLIHFFLTY